MSYIPASLTYLLTPRSPEDIGNFEIEVILTDELGGFNTYTFTVIISQPVQSQYFIPITPLDTDESKSSS